MTLEEFTHMVSAYGADPQRWPDEQLAAAQIFVSGHKAAAERILKDAEKLDEALSLLNPSPPSDLLRRRVMAGLDGEPKNQTAKHTVFQTSAPGWRGIAAMVVCAFGLGFGGAHLMQAGSITPEMAYAEASSAQENWELAANDLGLEEVYSWVEGTTESAGEL